MLWVSDKAYFYWYFVSKTQLGNNFKQEGFLGGNDHLDYFWG